MSDKIYLTLLGFFFLFSIPVCIRFPEYTILYAMTIIYAPFAMKGVTFYRRTLGKYFPGREVGNHYLYSLVGLPLGLIAALAEWQNIYAVMLFGAIAIIMVGVAEEIFRAGSIVLFVRFLKISPSHAIILANLSWIMFHFAIRPFNFWYFLFLCLAAIVFTFALVKGGLGAAIVAHVMSNSIASWITLATYGTNIEISSLSYSSLAVLMIIVFTIPLIGGMVKWQARRA